MPTQIQCIRIHRISLPMRVAFRHAAAERRQTENLIVEVELGDGTTGFGESVPRAYVSGETMDSAAAAVRGVFVDRLLSFQPMHFSEMLEPLEQLPYADAAGRAITSARAAVELALLDVYSRRFGRSLEELAGWIGTTAFGLPGSTETARYSAVISSPENGDAGADEVLRMLRLQRWLFGLRDVKLKVGAPDDRAVLEAVCGKLAGLLANGRASVRVDANGAWTPDVAAAWIEQMADLPIASVEQPMGREHDGELASLPRPMPLMVDESLVTPLDADRLISSRAADLFNIRISKNGGLMASMRLAEKARKAGIGFQLGCMVGETGLLSAAGRWFLRLVKGVRFAEGSFGRLLLRDDVTRPSPRFAWGGRVKPLCGAGLGVEVDRVRLAKYSMMPPEEIVL